MGRAWRGELVSDGAHELGNKGSRRVGRRRKVREEEYRWQASGQKSLWLS